MSKSPQKFVFQRAETWQYRRAQSVDERLAKSLRRVCSENEAIRACFLFDTRKHDGADVKLTITLSLDDEARDIEPAVIQLQEMLREFPEVAANTAIMSAKRFEQDYVGAEFYLRK